MKFKKLFEPVQIGSVEIKNRISNSAMVTSLCTAEGEITQRHINYMEERAKGGFGLLITEGSYPDPNKGRDFWGQMGCYDDKFILQMKKLTDTVHKYDTKIFLQIMVVGRQGDNRLINAPLDLVSNVPCPMLSVLRADSYKGEVMTVDRINEVIDQYVDAAVRAKDAGFDGVEIHAAHGYLIQQFLSLASNKRSDEYGCETIENRARFGVEVISAIKEALGDNLVVGMKIVGDEFVENGLTLEDMKIFAKIFENAGVDYFTVSCGTYANFMAIIPYMHFPLGNLEPYAAAIKQSVNVPVMAINRINDPVVAEEILQRGSADLVQMGRGSLADPHLPNKAKEGREDEIFHCLACLQGCAGRTFFDFPVACTVNPALGREAEYEELERTPIKNAKKVLVIGGGPAGMRCAYDAGRRGHHVVLCEKENELGGNIRFAARIPKRDGFLDLVRDLSSNLKKVKNVDILLGTEGNQALIESVQPDSVVLATGSKFVIPHELPGIVESTGSLAKNVLTVPMVFEEKATIGENVVIIGGNSIGLEVALYLAELKKNVTVLEKRPDLGMVQDINTFYVQAWVYSELEKKAVKIITGMAAKMLNGNRMIIDKAGIAPPFYDDYQFNAPIEEQTIVADTVILAMGRLPENKLAESLKSKVKELYLVGDCIGTDPKWAFTAIRQGSRIGMEL